MLAVLDTGFDDTSDVWSLMFGSKLHVLGGLRQSPERRRDALLPVLVATDMATTPGSCSPSIKVAVLDRRLEAHYVRFVNTRYI